MTGKRLRNSRLLRAGSHFTTWWLGTRLPDAVPLVFVVGYPKSGTTWACQLVADYLQLPFPRGSILPIGCPAVVHGHETVWPSYRRSVYVMRDGRDVMVSLFFHVARRIPDGDNPAIPRHLRKHLKGLRNKNDVRAYLPRFIESQVRDPFASRVHWGEHVSSFLDANHASVAQLKYERMLTDGVSALSEAARVLTGEEPDADRCALAVDRYSFSKQSNRKAGAEDRKSFLRKGEAGDWRNHFTREAAEIFDRHCGEALVAAGYAPDRSWVEECPVD